MVSVRSKFLEAKCSPKTHQLKEGTLASEITFLGSREKEGTRKSGEWQDPQT